MRTRTPVLAALGATLLISGCAMHRNGGDTAGATGGHYGDMTRTCEMHRQMTTGKTPAEQQAAMAAHVESRHGSATPQRVAHHARMMEVHCGDRAQDGVKP